MKKEKRGNREKKTEKHETSFLLFYATLNEPHLKLFEDEDPATIFSESFFSLEFETLGISTLGSD